MKAVTFKCEHVAPPNLAFSAPLMRSGYWTDQLSFLQTNPDQALKILSSDLSSLTQLRTKARKIGLNLLFARDATYTYIKIRQHSSNQKRLHQLLREPRTVDELSTKNLELNLKKELETLEAAKLVSQSPKGGVVRWTLTDNGTEELLGS